MATNLDIDPKLIERALKVSGERTKKAAVTKALEEFVARHDQKRLLDLVGKLEWDPGFDYKASRVARDRKLGELMPEGYGPLPQPRGRRKR